MAATTAWVRTTKTSACESCAAKDGCHTLGGGKEAEIEAINMIGAKTGDNVVIGFENSSLLKASFLVYVFPIISMMAGAVIGQEVAPNYDFSASALSMILGFLFFFLSFLLVRLIGNRMSEKENYRARIVRIKKQG
ncbi:SoxR reducing system RseC family protein [Desulfococcaceae bacterium HSG8]|nr:SoxR reducing system RseC family protein [Desulfococcaceae bacterium HSG8]